jgi:transposase-like protein
MSNQEQCPSCGGYKVNEEGGSGCASDISTHLILTIFTLGVWIIAWILIAAVESAMKSFSPKRDPALHSYTCQICGYKWTRREGTSRPKVNVRPEFLAKIESQRWKCYRCGVANEGSQSYCSNCSAPKM